MYTGRTLENKNREVVVLYLFIRIVYGVIRFTRQDTLTITENDIMFLKILLLKQFLKRIIFFITIVIF